MKRMANNGVTNEKNMFAEGNVTVNVAFEMEETDAPDSLQANSKGIFLKNISTLESLLTMRSRMDRKKQGGLFIPLMQPPKNLGPSGQHFNALNVLNKHVYRTSNL